MLFDKEDEMHHTSESIMKCSKCGSDRIVAPCNEPKVAFRCLTCGHEKLSAIGIAGGYKPSTSDVWENKEPHIVKI